MEEPSLRRRWLAAVAIIVLLLATWKLIDWRMQPPPPAALQKAGQP